MVVVECAKQETSNVPEDGSNMFHRKVGGLKLD
jgi:hypothetical protein